MRNIIVAVAFCCGCGSAVSTTTTTSAEIAPQGNQTSQEQAIQDISTIRCTRELSCGTIGKSAVGSCERDAREATRAVLIVRRCAMVDARRLSACLESIRNGPCGTADTLSERLASCGDVDLCQ